MNNVTKTSEESNPSTSQKATKRLNVSRDTFLDVPIADLDPNPEQPRSRLGDLSELARSIKRHGVQQPVTIAAGSNGRYTLITGHRRLEAAKTVGLLTIPAIVRDGDPAILALLENIQREQLPPLDEADAFRRLIDHKMTRKQLASELDVSENYIAGKLRLLKLPRTVKVAMSSTSTNERVGILSESAARQVLRLGILDRIATEKPWGQTVSESYMEPILWAPQFSRTVEAVQYGVDAVLFYLSICMDEADKRDDDELEAYLDKCQELQLDLMENAPTAWDTPFLHAAHLHRHYRPDFTRLTASDRQTISIASERYCADCELEAV